jgi:hypothetical protein
MENAVTWAALIAGIGAMVAVSTFWMKIGARLNKADSAAAIAQVALAKADLVSMQLAEYKVEAAGKFASSSDLADAERRFATACDGLSARFDRMAERLDRVLETIVDRRHEK